MRYFTEEMKRQFSREQKQWLRWMLLLLSSIVVAGGCSTLYLMPPLRYTSLGHVIRFVVGESGAEQTANDLADEIQSRIGAANLQRWAMMALARDRSRTLRLDRGHDTPIWPPDTKKIANADVPSFLLHTWPEVPGAYVRRSKKGTPECIVVSWGLYGIMAGPPGYMPENPWYLRQVRSGVYTYFMYK